MFGIVLAIHLVICACLIGAILLQPSEGGGALGIGGGPAGLMSGRSAANFMTRLTGSLAALFFITSLSLTIIASHNHKSAGSIMTNGTNPNDIPLNGIDLNATKKAATNQTSGSAIPQSQAAPSAGAALFNDTVDVLPQNNGKTAPAVNSTAPAKK